MTYIEFFDRISIENICACLIAQPDRVILLGNSKKVLARHVERYRRIFADRALAVTVDYDNVISGDIDATVSKLIEIVEREKTCVFDITGGDETLMVAVGIVYERYRENDCGISLSLYRSNVKSVPGTAARDSEQPAEGSVALTVEENVMLYGGNIAYSDEHPNGTYRWDMNDDFCRDIEVLWQLCRQDLRSWNVQIDMLGAIEEARSAESTPLCTVTTVSALERVLDGENKEYRYLPNTVNALLSAGYLTEFSREGNVIRVGYQNEQIKRCLTRAGQALEMKVFLAMRRVCDKRGVPRFSDVMNGVYMDWDGVLHADPWAVDAVNEIDIMAMRGLVPYFVSCKNGKVTADELYKLHTVATRFGGTYAKKVLVVNSLKKDHASNTLRQRAEEMDIRLIENVHRMKNDDELYRELLKI